MQNIFIDILYIYLISNKFTDGVNLQIINMSDDDDDSCTMNILKFLTVFCTKTIPNEISNKKFGLENLIKSSIVQHLF